MILLYLFIISTLLLGTIIVGPYSIRVYATVLSLAYILLNRRKLKISRLYTTNKSYLFLFLCYTILLGVSLIACGEFAEYDFVKKFLAYFLVCIVAFLLMDYEVKSKNDILKVVYLLSAIMNVDAIITILQYSGNEYGWVVGMFFGDISQNIEFLATHGDIASSSSNTPGIFGDTVANAFMLGSITPLYYLIISCNGNNQKIYGLLSVVLAAMAIFMTQQRASFGLFVISLIMINWSLIRKSSIARIAAMMCLLIGIVLFNDVSISQENLGRLAEKSNDDRAFLWQSAVSFIFENPLFGGPMEFQKRAGVSAHNIVLDSWIYSGILGFCVMMALYFKTIFACMRRILLGIKRNNLVLYPATALLVSMVYGLFHNTSYMHGDVILFILLVLFLKSEQIFRTERI